jgi:hypothetical protein
LVVLTLVSVRSFGQTDTIEILAETLLQECSKYCSSKEGVCSKVDVDEIKNKLKKGETYLNSQLKQLALSDTSIYLEEQKKALQKLDENYDVNSTDDEKILKKFEKQYLLLALLSVTKSGKYFDRFIQLYFNCADSKRSCEEWDSYPNLRSNDHPECIASESLLLFKAWLYDLLIERFHQETDSFTKNKSLSFYNWIVLYSNSSFTGDLIREDDLISKLSDWADYAIKGNYLSEFTTKEELLASAYRLRASLLSKWNSEIQDESVFNYGERLLLESLDFKHDPMTEYSLGILYYNRALHLSKALESDQLNEDRDILDKRVSKLKYKGIELMEKAYKELEKEK